jgi:hypothetical protein
LAYSTITFSNFRRLSFSAIYSAILLWFRQQTDLLPPYHAYAGELWGKHIKDGRFYLELEGNAVEVDSLTYGLLEVGETIRARYTRRLRVINLDRFPSDDEHVSGDSNQ